MGRGCADHPGAVPGCPWRCGRWLCDRRQRERPFGRRPALDDGRIGFAGRGLRRPTRLGTEAGRTRYRSSAMDQPTMATAAPWFAALSHGTVPRADSARSAGGSVRRFTRPKIWRATWLAWRQGTASAWCSVQAREGNGRNPANRNHRRTPPHGPAGSRCGCTRRTADRRRVFRYLAHRPSRRSRLCEARLGQAARGG